MSHYNKGYFKLPLKTRFNVKKNIQLNSNKKGIGKILNELNYKNLKMKIYVY